jgi:hypothetical protein
VAEPNDPGDPFPSCDVCGRTILKGEQIHEYLTPSRERIRVCVLCRSRAESEGWIPATMAHALEDEQPRRGRRLALRQRFSRAAARARTAARTARPEPEPEPEPQPVRDPEIEAPAAPERPVPEPVAADADPEPDPEPAAEPAPPPPAKPRPGRQPGARKPKGTEQKGSAGATRRSRAKKGPEALMRRAVERFNSSEERRKVAGLMRSLGEPQAGVQPDPRRQSALVTVGWELSWYQWEVGAEDDRDEPVREVAKGAELNELDDAARAWNALVDEDGSLRLRSAAARQPQEAANEA